MKATLAQVRPETFEASTFTFTAEATFVYKPEQHLNMRLAIANPDSRGSVLNKLCPASRI